MNLHEYQARTLMKAAGIPTIDGDVASTPTEAESIARRVGVTAAPASRRLDIARSVRHPRTLRRSRKRAAAGCGATR